MPTVQDLVLTPDQEACVMHDEQTPHLLITGVPGSGKTVVLLKRACRLANIANTIRSSVAVFTYNKTLATFIDASLEENACKERVLIDNFHRWVWTRLPRYIADRTPLLTAAERRGFVQKTLNDYQKLVAATPVIWGHDAAWWEAEFQWIKGRGILDLFAYQASDRAGRVTGLDKERARPVVWQVFEAYEALLAQARRIEFDDYARVLLRMGEPTIRHLSFDHILVDEAQDLSGSDLMLLRMLTRRTLTVVADLGQKLYNKSYDWNDLGIDVQRWGPGRVPKSRRLHLSYRSPREIVACAESLRQRDTTLSREELQYTLPERSGPKPIVYAAASEDAEEEEAVRKAIELARAHRDKTVALVARQWETVVRLLPHIPPDVPAELLRDHEGAPCKPGVKLTTAHSCKGLEFDFVILVHVNEGILPISLPEPPASAPEEEWSDFARVREDHLNAERRLLYVPMSRARAALFMTHSPQRSRFLDELDYQLYVSSTTGL